MTIAPFETEQFYARYEFGAPHLLSASDCETLSVSELLTLAGTSLEDIGELKLGYTEPQGDPALRRDIAATYRSVAPGEVVVLSSPIEGIYLTMRTLLEPGDEAIVLTPTYDALKNIPEHIGRAITWPLVPDANGWQLDFEHLETLITAKSKLLLINFPHNPTGFLPAPSDLDRLLAFAEERGLWVYSDEMYRGLEFGSAPQLASVCDRYERSVTLSGLSKTYGLPGLRSGWLVVKDRAVRERLMNWKMYTSICASAPAEYLARIALSVRERLAERNRSVVRDNVLVAESFFARWPGLFTWRPPLAGSTALVGLTTGSASDYCHTLADEAGVVLLPSGFLAFPDTFVRFGFGRSSFTTALSAYERFLETS